MADRTKNPRRPMPIVRHQLRPESNEMGYINDMVVCPYNSRHVMKYHKLMPHLRKCEKEMETNGGVDSKGQGVHTLPVGYEKCPYNSLHRYPCGERDKHFQACKDRAEDLMARISCGESLEGIDDRYLSPGKIAEDNEAKAMK